MYHDDPFDVVLTELVANSLDSKASEILIDWNPESRVLVITDNGRGMDSEAFEQYHDFAAELKPRGTGIGFAGVGAKISFNIASQVITETRCDGVTSASDWGWDRDGSLRWNRVESSQLETNGTRVEVRFSSGRYLPGLIDDGYLIDVLKRHYLPLFATEFARSYSVIGLYPETLRFIVNGSPIQHASLATVATLSSHSPFKVASVGWGTIGVSNREYPMGSTAFGLLLCTHGKVIKPELFGLSTGSLGARLFGVVEIPGLIEYVTTSKSDLRSGQGKRRGLNKLLDPVRDRLKAFLADHGVAMVEQRRDHLSAKLERELSRLVPQLHELHDFDGLLRRSRSLRKSDTGQIPTSEVREQPSSGTVESADVTKSDGDPNGTSGSSRQPDSNGTTPAKRRRSRRNQGPRVAFEEHPGRDETAWIESNTIVINVGHAAYRERVNQDQARFTYCMFAIGVALDKADLATDGGINYVDRFISAWGHS